MLGFLVQLLYVRTRGTAKSNSPNFFTLSKKSYFELKASSQWLIWAI